MLTAEHILSTFKQQESLLRKEYGVVRIGVFGSVATGTNQHGSDIDLLVETETPDFVSLMSLQAYLEDLFSCKVDLVRMGPHLSARFKKEVASTLRYA